MRIKRSSPGDSRGFTLLEVTLTAGLAAGLILVLALGIRTVGGLIGKSKSLHELEAEGFSSTNLLTSLLRQADPASVELASGPGGPWSRLRFTSGRHAYEFYGEGATLYFQADQLKPKALSAHLVALQFSLQRARLPTLMKWSLRLGNNAGSMRPAQVSISGIHFLDHPAE